MVVINKSMSHPVFDLYEYEYDSLYEKELSERYRKFIASDIDEATKEKLFLNLIHYLHKKTIENFRDILNDFEISHSRTSLTVNKLASDITTLHSMFEKNEVLSEQDRNYLCIVLSRITAMNYTIAKVNNGEEATAIAEFISLTIEG